MCVLSWCSGTSAASDPGIFRLLVIYCQENTRRWHVEWGVLFSLAFGCFCFNECNFSTALFCLFVCFLAGQYFIIILFIVTFQPAVVSALRAPPCPGGTEMGGGGEGGEEGGAGRPKAAGGIGASALHAERGGHRAEGNGEVKPPPREELLHTRAMSAALRALLRGG